MSERASRRDFLHACSIATAISAYALSTEGHFCLAEESLKIPNTAERRNQLLDAIATIVDSDGEEAVADAAVRTQQMSALRPAVAGYIQLLNDAPDLTLQELQKAVEINFGKINMTHFSDGQEPGAAETFIMDVAMDFYRALTVKLAPISLEHGESGTGATMTLQKIRGDIIWAHNHKNEGIDQRCGEFFFKDHTRNLDQFDLKAFMKGATYPGRPIFYLPLIRDHGALVERLCKNVIEDLSRPVPKDVMEKVQHYVFLHQRLLGAVATAESQKRITPESADTFRERIHQTVERPFLDRLFEIQLAVVRAQSPQVRFVSTSPVPGTTTPPPCRNEIQKPFIDLLARLGEADLLKLGATFIQKLESWVTDTDPEDGQRASFYAFLPYLPCPQESLDFVSADLERFVAKDLGTQFLAGSMTPLLGATVLATYLSAPKDGEVAASSLLTQSNTAIEQIHADAPVVQTEGVSPLQSLIAKLAWSVTHSNTAVPFNLEVAQSPGDEKLSLSHLAVMLVSLAEDAWSMCGAEFLRSPKRLEILEIPSDWGPRPVLSGQYLSPEELGARMVPFLKLIEGSAAELFRPAALKIPYQDLTDRTMLLMRMITSRLQYMDYDKMTFAPEVMAFKESFPPISIRSREGPFVHLFHSARNVIYRNSLGTDSPGPLPSDEVARLHYKTDVRLDAVAEQLAVVTEELFVCDILRRLWPVNGTRPFPQYQSLAPARFANELTRLLHLLALSDRHPKILEILSTRPATEIPDRLGTFRDNAAERQAKILKSMSR